MEPTKNDAAESVRIIAARRDCFDVVIGVLGGSRRCQYRARQQMVLTLFLWRKGWDSNPRCGSPHTAFPVLPVKPLLHLSPGFRIADFRMGICFSIRIHQSDFRNLCRRGWDSNPRWA